MEVLCLDRLDRVRGGLSREALGQIIQLRKAHLDSLQALMQNPDDPGLLANESSASQAAAGAWKQATAGGGPAASASPTAGAGMPALPAAPAGAPPWVASFLQNFWS